MIEAMMIGDNSSMSKKRDRVDFEDDDNDYDIIIELLTDLCLLSSKTEYYTSISTKMKI